MASKKYKFRFKNSTEAISITEANSEYEATVHFAKIKNLDVDAFLELYVVFEG